MIPLAALLANRKLMLYGGLALALAFGAWRFAKWNQEIGKQDANQVVAEDLNKRVDAEIGAYKAQALESDARAAKFAAETQAALNRADAERRRGDAAYQQALSAKAAVGHIPDDGLLLDVRKKLNIVPDFTQPDFTYAELRKIDEIVSAQPHIDEQLKALAGQIEGLQSGQRKAAEQIEEMKDQIQRERQFSDKLYLSYTTAYNLIPRKSRKAGCLWLWKCGKSKPLGVPEPGSLVRPVT